LDGVLVEFNGNLIMTRSSTHKLFKFMRKKWILKFIYL
jgi:hypothetical protein